MEIRNWSIEDYKKDYKAFLEDTHQKDNEQSKNIYIGLLTNKYTIYRPTIEQIEQLRREL